MYKCVVCDGTGWTEYSHPDGEGGMGTAVTPCPACVEDGLCPACGEGGMAWGTLLICVHCGFTFDAAENPGRSVAAGTVGINDSDSRRMA